MDIRRWHIFFHASTYQHLHLFKIMPERLRPSEKGQKLSGTDCTSHAMEHSRLRISRVDLWDIMICAWCLQTDTFSVCCWNSLVSLLCCCSVTKSCPTLCNPKDCSTSRLTCPSLSPGACSNSCPLNQWCHPASSSSVTSFSSCLQSFPASGSFPMSWLFASGGQSIGASASALVLPMNIQGWFPLRLTGWISLQSKELSRLFSSTAVWKHQFCGAQPSSWSHSHVRSWLLEKP